MGKQRMTRSQRPPRWRRPWILAVGLVVIALGGGAYWWSAEAPEPTGGTPRLALEREVIDFGHVPFDRFVDAVFTLKNTGDGVLRLADVPRVKALEGC
jgi:hypothetical protein